MIIILNISTGAGGKKLSIDMYNIKMLYYFELSSKKNKTL